MPLLPPHPGPLPQILRVTYKALETVFREVFGGEGAKMRNFKTRKRGTPPRDYAIRISSPMRRAVCPLTDTSWWAACNRTAELPGGVLRSRVRLVFSSNFNALD